MSSVILAIDTSSRTVGLALYDGIQVLSETVWTSRDFHTVELAPSIGEILGKSDRRIEDLGALTISLGPGSFTGLRIGMAVAKGICLARKIPLIGIPTLDALAVAQPIRELPMAAVLHAGRGRLAVGWYRSENDSWISTGEIELLSPKELSDQIKSPTLICGELSGSERRIIARKHKNAQLASPAHSLRRPAFLAELGWERWQDGDVENLETLAPIYLHHHKPVQNE